MTSDEELIDLIYAALLGEQPWQKFLICLASGIPNGSALFFAQGFGARPEFSALHYGLPEASLDAYGSHFATINPWIRGTEATAPGKAIAGHRICAQDLVRRSEYYNDFLRPLGIETSSGLVIERRPDVQFNLTILSGQDSPEATVNGGGKTSHGAAQ